MVLNSATTSTSIKTTIDGFQQPPAVDHAQDIDRFSPDFVDESVAVDEMFANLRGAGFRHRPTHHGLRSKKFRRDNNLFDNAAGMLGRVTADIFADGLDNPEGLFRPDQ
mgnify:CR=1 FL=1